MPAPRPDSGVAHTLSQLRYGEELLKECLWDGYLDLTDEEQMELFWQANPVKPG